MKNVLIALGLTLAATSGAFADSTALDAVYLPQNVAASNPAAPIAQTNDANQFTQNGPFSDRSPTYTQSGAQIDYTATASISDGHSADLAKQPRLGDGARLPY
jgi:hypothetical protein